MKVIDTARIAMSTMGMLIRQSLALAAARKRVRELDALVVDAHEKLVNRDDTIAKQGACVSKLRETVVRLDGELAAAVNAERQADAEVVRLRSLFGDVPLSPAVAGSAVALEEANELRDRAVLAANHATAEANALRRALESYRVFVQVAESAGFIARSKALADAYRAVLASTRPS